MSDEELRELERRWRESGAEGDAMRLLQAQLRCGYVTAAEILSCTIEHSAAQRAKNELERRAEAERQAEALAATLREQAALETLRTEVSRGLARDYMPRTLPYRPYQAPLERRAWTDHSCETHEPLLANGQWGDWQIGARPGGQGQGWYRRCRFCPLRRFFLGRAGGGCPNCLHAFHARAACPDMSSQVTCGCTGPQPQPRERR